MAAMDGWKDLTRLAERAHGIVSHDELAAAGLSKRQLRRWVEDGRLVDTGYGTFRLGGVPPSFAGEVLSAIKAFPDETWASHHTAARLLGLPAWSADDRIELTRPTGLSAERVTAQVHRSNRILPHHVTVVDGVPCTCASRTVFDLARTTGPKALTRVVDRALHLRICTMVSLYRTLYEMGGPGRPGTRRAREVFEGLGIDHVPPESGLEAVGMALLEGLGFVWQVELSDDRGYIRRVDGIRSDVGLIVEFDGPHHRREPQRSLDVDGDQRLRRMGYDVVRITWADVTTGGPATRERLVARIRSAAA